MKLLIKIEELFMFILGIYLFSLLDYSWYWFLIFLLAPDIGMIGYLINTKAGASTYNLFHHKAVAIAVYLLGIFLTNPILQFVGIIMFSHSSLDRTLDYGLKHPDSFKHTHLGEI